MEDFVDLTILMRPICGVYILLYGDFVVYVGKSRDVPKRIRDHCNRMANTNGFKFTKVMVRTCSRFELDRLEFAYISRYKPIHNKQNLGVPKGLEHVKVDLEALGITVLPKIKRRF